MTPEPGSVYFCQNSDPPLDVAVYQPIAKIRYEPVEELIAGGESYSMPTDA
jgi:hypothetical protein